jgi:hypothetical protein
VYEFSELSISRPWGGIPLARKLTKTERRFERCVVSHPDAGGECGRFARFEVYGLTFCEPHGLEANCAALLEYFHQAEVAAEQVFYNPNAVTPHPELRTAYGAVTRRFMDKTLEYEEAYDGLAEHAFPLLEGRVMADVLGWEPGAVGPSPYEAFGEEALAISRFMREAHQDGLSKIVSHLEPLRERTAAQAAYARIIQDRKTAELRASRGG